MKLILANNQSEKFIDFYNGLSTKSTESFDYSGYSDLLFIFDSQSDSPIQVFNIAKGKSLVDYDGVYINGYLNAYELAAATAISCQSLGIPFHNREMQNPPSLSKLSMYAKLAAMNVTIPRSIVASKQALLAMPSQIANIVFPAILKRADADRGIDNYKVKDLGEIKELLQEHPESSIWVVQDYVENEGYYLVSFYDDKPSFCIYRTLEKRPDNNAQKAHMYKPVGGVNASLIPLDDVPEGVISECTSAAEAMNRQICSVDCIYEQKTKRTHILEVNYNPQLVTIKTLKDVRIKAFLDNIKTIG